MKINAEFDQRVVIHSESMDWQDSPMPGVSRRPLDRVGGEVARATSIVRYESGSKFSSHVHTGGEEFLVIEGVFQDEHGDFPVGSYIRNPPESFHTPGSELGCVIFVKLWQFELKDRTHVRLNPNFMTPIPHRDRAGVAVTPLYADNFEEVTIQDWDADTEVLMDLEKGAEVFVLDGSFTDKNDVLVKHSWLRIPVGGRLNAKVGASGARIWMKEKHLPYVDAQIERVNNR